MISYGSHTPTQVDLILKAACLSELELPQLYPFNNGTTMDRGTWLVPFRVHCHQGEGWTAQDECSVHFACASSITARAAIWTEAHTEECAVHLITAQRNLGLQGMPRSTRDFVQASMLSLENLGQEVHEYIKTRVCYLN